MAKRKTKRKTKLLDRTSIHAASMLRSKEDILDALDDLSLVLGIAMSTDQMSSQGAIQAMLYSEALWWVLGIDVDPLRKTVSPASVLIDAAEKANMETTSRAEKEGVDLTSVISEVFFESVEPMNSINVANIAAN
ncbi:MAG: hypothetical protein K2Z81_23325 [Cyanobacteria bacterium]|nr:hypothetical protein [Cyanobacteriota bacterium]